MAFGWILFIASNQVAAGTEPPVIPVFLLVLLPSLLLATASGQVPVSCSGLVVAVAGAFGGYMQIDCGLVR